MSKSQHTEGPSAEFCVAEISTTELLKACILLQKQVKNFSRHKAIPSQNALQVSCYFHSLSENFYVLIQLLQILITHYTLISPLFSNSIDNYTIVLFPKALTNFSEVSLKIPFMGLDSGLNVILLNLQHCLVFLLALKATSPVKIPPTSFITESTCKEFNGKKIF